MFGFDPIDTGTDALEDGYSTITGGVDAGTDAIDTGTDWVSGGVDTGTDALWGGVDAGTDALWGGVDAGTDAIDTGTDAIGAGVDTATDVATAPFRWTASELRNYDAIKRAERRAQQGSPIDAIMALLLDPVIGGSLLLLAWIVLDLVGIVPGPVSLLGGAI